MYLLVLLTGYGWLKGNTQWEISIIMGDDTYERHPWIFPIIPRQLCAFLLLALNTAVSSRTRSLCSLHIAVDPKASFLYSKSCVHPSSFHGHCSNSEQMAVWHLLLCSFIIIRYAKPSHRNIIHIRLEVKSKLKIHM